MTKTYLALDLELFWDEHLYEAHRAMDSKSDRRATAVKRVMAASVFEFSIDEEGRIATGEIASWTEHDWGDEKAVVEQLFDYLRARADITVLTFGGLATDLGVGAGTETAGRVPSDVEFDVGVAHQQRLRVGVDRDELNAFEALLDHPVDGVDAAAADTDHLDHSEVVMRGGHVRPSCLMFPVHFRTS